MSVSNLEIYQLTERMTKTLTDVAMGQPRHAVVEAVVHAAVAIVAACVGPDAAPDALKAGAAVFSTKADEARVGRDA